MFKRVSIPSVHFPRYKNRQEVCENSLREGRNDFALAFIKVQFPSCGEIPKQALKIGAIQKAYEFRHESDYFYLSPEYQAFFRVYEFIKVISIDTLSQTDIPALIGLRLRHTQGYSNTQWIALTQPKPGHYGFFDPLDKQWPETPFPEGGSVSTLLQAAIQKRQRLGYSLERLDRVQYLDRQASLEGTRQALLFESGFPWFSGAPDPVPSMLAGGTHCYPLSFWCVSQAMGLNLSSYRLPALQAAYHARFKEETAYLPEEFRAFLRVEEVQVLSYDYNQMVDADFNAVLSIQKKSMEDPKKESGHSIALVRGYYQGKTEYGVFDPATKQDGVIYNPSISNVKELLKDLFYQYEHNDKNLVTQVIKLSYKRTQPAQPLWGDTE